MLGSKSREIGRLKRLVASLRTRLKGAEQLRDTAVANQARIIRSQTATFRIVAAQIAAARESDNRAFADALVEELEAGGFGPQLELALHRTAPKAGNPA